MMGYRLLRHRFYSMIAASCVCSLCASAAAQESPADAPRTISLPDALTYARAHQPVIRAALARVAADRAQAKVPRAQWMPAFGGTAQAFAMTANNTTGTYLNTNAIDIPRIGGTTSVRAGTASLSPYASTIVAVGATQEIFDFGRIAAQSAAADALIEVSSHDADAQRLDVELNVEEAYFAVHAAKEVLAAAEGAYERSRVHRDFARSGVQSGLHSPIELTRAEADLQRFDIGRIRARGGLSIAQAVLAASIGAPEPALDITGPPPSANEMPALASAMSQATRRDPRLLEAFARLKAQEERTRAIGAALRPELFATGTLSGRAGGAAPSGSGDRADFAGALPTVPNWDVGLVLSWPFYDATVTARQDASRAAEDVHREEMEVARQGLVASIGRAYLSVNVAREALPGLRRSVEAAVANYAQADARFKAGLGTSVELADA
jgi:outer membrane protein